MFSILRKKSRGKNSVTKLIMVQKNLVMEEKLSGLLTLFLCIGIKGDTINNALPDFRILVLSIIVPSEKFL